MPNPIAPHQGQNQIEKIRDFIRATPPQKRVYKAGTIDEKERIINLVFSSEEPVLREDFWTGQLYYEVLDHAPENVDLSRLNDGAHPFLKDHDHRQQLGVVVEAVIGDDRQGRAKARISKTKRVNDDFQDIKDGIRQLISVGYEVLEVVDYFIRPDDIPVFRLKWRPFEISSVAIPADATVGVGRDKPQTPKKDFNPMSEPNTTPAPAPVATPAPAPVVDVKAERDRGRNDERQRISDITSIGERFKASVNLIQTAIREGYTVDRLRAAVLDERFANDGANIDTQETHVDLTPKEQKQYSLSRVINAVLEGRPTDAGLEMEVSQEIARKTGKKPRSFYVPHDLIASRALAYLQNSDQARRRGVRELTTAGSAGNLIATDNLAGSFIGMLRNKSVLTQLGARSLSGLVGDITIPKQTGAATGGWIAEGASQALSDQTFGSLPLSPKTVSARTKMSRQVIQQSNPDVEALVMEDLINVIALTIDLGGIAGTGLSNQPTGIINTSGIGGVDGATMDWDAVVELETDVAAANADVGTMHYLSNATVRGLLKTRKIDAGSGLFLLQNGEMNGYPHAMSNQVPAATMIFGAFSQVIMALWGALDVLVNPYKESETGAIFIDTFQSVDVGIRHAASFSVMTSIS